MRSEPTILNAIARGREEQRMRELFGTDWLAPGLEMTPLARAFDWHPIEPRGRILLPCDKNGKSDV